MAAVELIEQLETCSDDDLATALDRLTALVSRLQRHAERRRLVSLAEAAAAELADEPALDADGIRAWLGRDRASA